MGKVTEGLRGMFKPGEWKRLHDKGDYKVLVGKRMFCSLGELTFNVFALCQVEDRLLMIFSST